MLWWVIAKLGCSVFVAWLVCTNIVYVVANLNHHFMSNSRFSVD